MRVLCCAAARPARRPGVDSFEVDPTGAQQPYGPSEPMVDSAGTTRPLCAPHPLIACTVLLPLSHRQRTVARSTPDGPYHSVKPIASVDARWVWTHPERLDCRARHAVSGERASSRGRLESAVSESRSGARAVAPVTGASVQSCRVCMGRGSRCFYDFDSTKIGSITSFSRRDALRGRWARGASLMLNAIHTLNGIYQKGNDISKGQP